MGTEEATTKSERQAFIEQMEADILAFDPKASKFGDLFYPCLISLFATWIVTLETAFLANTDLVWIPPTLLLLGFLIGMAAFLIKRRWWEAVGIPLGGVIAFSLLALLL